MVRALAVEPEVLLLDEPFGALDAKVRQELRHWLREIHQKLNITTIFVTHDQEEALEMADTVVVMNHGGIEQVGSPEEVYQNPTNAFVYSFWGRVNKLKGDILLCENGNEITDDAVGYIRPYETGLTKEDINSSSNPSKVIHVHAVGAVVRVQLQQIESTNVFEAEITMEEYQKLGPLKRGDIINAIFKNIIKF